MDGLRLLDSLAFATLAQLSPCQLLSLDAPDLFTSFEPLRFETQAFRLPTTPKRKLAEQVLSIDFVTESDLKPATLFAIDWNSLKSQMPKAVDRGWDLDVVNRWRHKCVWFGWVSRF